MRPDRFVAGGSMGASAAPAEDLERARARCSRGRSDTATTAVRVTALDYDVALVGYGPVGQTAAALLGDAGHRVGVFERFGCLYDLPRAIHFDHEIMRVWQQLGIVDELEHDLLPIHEYRWFGADGEPIMTMRAQSPRRRAGSPTTCSSSHTWKPRSTAPRAARRRSSAGGAPRSSSSTPTTWS